MGYMSLPVSTQWEEPVTWSHATIRKARNTSLQVPGKNGKRNRVKQSNDNHSAPGVGLL